jgi:hypothetical protein
MTIIPRIEPQVKDEMIRGNELSDPKMIRGSELSRLLAEII